jgi:outer membrane receptor protein involved in Fe transport
MHALNRVSTMAMATLVLMVPSAALSQQTGTVTGKVTDENGAPVGSAQIFIERAATQSRADGGYTLEGAPTGARTLRARMLGFAPESASVTVTAGQTVTHDFTLRRDPLQLQTMVVTGTQTPRQNLDASVAVTTLTSREVEQAAPRSTTEMLRYVPGFTRVESSGGEVNQNISMRGILGVEYVMFMEDGMPVFPTMHTFFMNADNLFRFDQNIERMEVVRGGASALFGSNTPGAIINFINKTGGEQFGGTMRVEGGSKAYARYDVDAGGPLGKDWRFNMGGFYRYDHGVRDPGFPGIRGGQAKANITRVLSNGYIRISGKYLDDRNQFILPLPFTNSGSGDPEYVPGFGNYGSMSTNEGLDISVPTPDGDLKLPLGNGLRTKAGWVTVDAALDLQSGWRIQNTAQVMQNSQEWNAIVPSNAQPVADYAAGVITQLGLPAGSTAQFVFTNHFDDLGQKLPFDTPNGLVAPSGEWHVEKPISAIQDQLQLRRSFGPHTLSVGAYFANYTQDNRWNFTDILLDVRDNPRFLDMIVTTPTGTVDVTNNGFRNYRSLFINGSGQASVLSGVVGGEVQLTPKLRADLGVRVEYDDYVQTSENSSTEDMDGDPNTPFDNAVQFGNNSFRHFTNSITDWAGSLGLNYVLRDNLSLYVAGSRGYKMPALDEFLQASSQAQVDLFDSREVQSVEGGVKAQVGKVAFTVNGFYTKLKNIIGQGAETDPVTGGTIWVIRTSPQNRSFGAEVEAIASPVEGLQLQGSATFLNAELGGGVDSLASKVGLRLAGVPKTLGNLVALYTPPRAGGLQLKADWHWVGSRLSEDPLTRLNDDLKLPGYNYFNFGAGFDFPNSGVRLDVQLLNAFQSKGLEEGNPRLPAAGVTPFFLARPLLPRRLQAAVTYDFGGAQ